MRIASESAGNTPSKYATNCSRACRAMDAVEAGGNCTAMWVG